MLCFASEISHSLYSVSSFNPQLKGHFPREALFILHRLMGASLVAQLVKNPPAMQETTVGSLVGKIPWRRNRLPTPAFLGSSGGSAGKESACNAGDPDSIPGLRRSPEEGIGYPLQYSWTSIVTQLVKSACNAGDLGLIPGSGRTPGEGNGNPLQYSCLENPIPWTEVPGGLQFMGSQESDMTE